MRELRNRDPKLFRLITIRTSEARLWLTPNASGRSLLGGILARYQEIFKVEIYVYTFLTNHYHLIIRAPYGNADEFLENVNREISRRVNRLNNREGHLWGRRYVDQEILSEDDLLDAFLYVLTNACHHGLTREPSNWPGLNSIAHVLNETDRKFSFRHYSKPGAPVTTHKLKISRLPQFKAMSNKARRRKISALLLQKVEEIREKRGEKFMPPDEIFNHEVGAKPLQSKRSPRAPFFSKCIRSYFDFLPA